MTPHFPKHYFSLLVIILASSVAYLLIHPQNYRFSKPVPSAPEFPVVPETGQIPVDFDTEAGIKNTKPHVFKGETKYEIREEEGDKFLSAVSEKTSSALFKEAKVDIRLHPKLKWQWKAVRFPEGKKHEALNDRSENDFVARIYVIFEGGRFSRDVIQYVWDDTFPVGISADNSAMNKVKMLVVRSGPAAEGWVTEERDLAKDYETLFGRAANRNISGIGVMTDSDNLQAAAEAYYKNMNFEFEKRDSSELPLAEPEKKSVMGRAEEKIKQFTSSFWKKIPKPSL